MTILLTGSTGFLGKIILETLAQYSITTIGRINCEIAYNFKNSISTIAPSDLVVHAAGMAHTVAKTALQHQLFFDVNVAATQNFLTSLEQSNAIPKYFIFISSVSVYGQIKGNNITENFELLASDPYGKSKIEAEYIIFNWCKKHNVICTHLRLPLLVGKNPKGNLQAMTTAINKGFYFNIGKGNAKKSMVLASDVAKILPHVAAIGGVYNLTDGCHPSFKEMGNEIAKKLHKKTPFSIPKFVAFAIAIVGNGLGKFAPLNANKYKKIVSSLTFSDQKAREKINWKPLPVLENLDNCF
jgi:nucleoside-diphosphate-sugar epimerase